MKKKKIKKNKLYFTDKKFMELFDYATSIREETLDFCDKLTDYKTLIDTAYEPKTKKVLKQMFRELGIVETRNKLKAMAIEYGLGVWCEEEKCFG